MGGKTSTSTSGVSIPPSVLAQYNSVNQSAGQTAQTPFQTYGKNAAPVAPGYNDTNSGTFVAPTNAEQAKGTSDINAATQPISGSDINSYLSPYLGDVLSSTEALQNQSNQQQQAGQLGNAISSGAFGGDRTGIAAANLEGQQNLANSNVIAGIANQGYNTALSTAEQEQQVGLAGGQAEIGAGTVQQQTQQAQDTAEYNQFLQQQSYPFQVDQFLANIAEGTGSLSGSTTTTTQPGGFFSDKRLKRDIKKIGETYDHQDVVTYKMGEDKRTRIGLIAQDVEKKHPEAVGVAGGFKTVDYGKATEKAANQGHFYAGGVVPIGRKRYADGGASDGLAGVLEAQQAMYSGMPGGGGRRQINESGSGGGGHSLAVSNAPGVAPQSGISQVNSGINTVNNGYKLYGNLTKAAGSPSGGVVPSSATQAAAQPAGLQGAGLQASGVTTAGAPEAAATAAPEAAAGAGAGDAAAAGAADAAATGAAADAAGTAAAGAAGTAAATAGTTAAAEAAAALAAEYAAADVGMAALMVAKRGGRIRKKFAAGGAGGTPYLEGGLDSSGDLNIPEDPNTSTLKAAPGAGKQPTGLQTMMTMGDPTKWSSLAGGMFSNQALATGGVAGRRGYADSGAVVDSADLPEVDVTANRDAPAYDTAQVPDQTAADVTASDPSGPGPAASDNTGVAAAAPTAATKSLWDKIKGSALAKPENWIPLANAISAMGTAKTVHPGVALAAGLGAGANSYQGEQTALAQQGRTEAVTGLTEAQTRGADIRNQISAMQAKAAGDYFNSPPGPTGVVPYLAPEATGVASAPTGAAPAAPANSAAATAQNIDQNYRQKYFVQPGYLPDEQAAMQKALRASMVLGDTPVKTVQQAHENRVQTQQSQNQNGAQAEADQLYAQATDPTADPSTQQAALVKYNALHQWTGDKYNDASGSIRNTRTGQPPIGVAAQALTPEQMSARVAEAQTLVEVPQSDGSTVQVPKWRAVGAASPQAYAQQTAGAGQTPTNGAGAAPARSAPSRVPRVAPAEQPQAQVAAPLAKALADPEFKVSTPPVRSGVSPTPAALEQQKATVGARTELLKDSQDATSTAAQSLTYLNAAQQIISAKGMPPTGIPGQLQMEISKWTGGTGVNATNYQEVAKYLSNSALQNARATYGARMTQSEVQLQLNEMNPSLHMTPRAIGALVQENARNAQYAIDSASRAPKFLADGGDPQKFAQWNQQYFPRQTIVNAGVAGTSNKPDHGGFIAGRTYKDAKGNTGVYLGNGKWQ